MTKRIFESQKRDCDSFPYGTSDSKREVIYQIEERWIVPERFR